LETLVCPQLLLWIKGLARCSQIRQTRETEKSCPEIPISVTKRLESVGRIIVDGQEDPEGLIPHYRYFENRQ